MLCSVDGEQWKKQYTFEHDGDPSGEYYIQRPELSRKFMSAPVLQAFLRYNLTVPENNEANDLLAWLNVCLAYLDVWVGTVVKCLRENETVGATGQKLYAEIYGRLFLTAMKELTVNM